MARKSNSNKAKSARMSKKGARANARSGYSFFYYLNLDLNPLAPLEPLKPSNILDSNIVVFLAFFLNLLTAIFIISSNNSSYSLFNGVHK